MGEARDLLFVQEPLPGLEGHSGTPLRICGLYLNLVGTFALLKTPNVEAHSSAELRSFCKKIGRGMVTLRDILYHVIITV